MEFRVDFKSGLPVYLQLVEQVRYAIASGSLRPGNELAAIRPLAEQLRVNRNTVAKAYAELESQGVIETRAGKGCFVKSGASPFTQSARHRLLEEKIDAAVVTAHHLGVDAPTFIELARERLARFGRDAAKNNANGGKSE